MDETGLTGDLDVTLEWFSDPVIRPDGTAAPAEGPSVFTALRAQAGLRLVPEKAMDEMIVIEHVARPSANS